MNNIFHWMEKLCEGLKLDILNLFIKSKFTCLGSIKINFLYCVNLDRCSFIWRDFIESDVAEISGSLICIIIGKGGGRKSVNAVC